MSSQGKKNLDIALQALCGLALAANLLVVIVVATTKQLRNKYYALIFSLAVADIVFVTLGILYTNQYSLLVASLFRTAYFAAELNVLAVAVNRLLALSLMPPARYDALVTPCRIAAACLLIWIVSAGIYVPTSYIRTPVVTRVIRPSIALLVLCLTGGVYYLVFRKIARYAAAQASNPGAGNERDKLTGTRVQHIRHFMFTFVIILVASVVFWIPHCIAQFIMYTSGKSYRNQSPGFKEYFSASLLLLVLNSVVNPLIYWWRFGEFREGLGRLTGCSCRRRETADTDVESVNMETAVESAM